MKVPELIKGREINTIPQAKRQIASNVAEMIPQTSPCKEMQEVGAGVAGLTATVNRKSQRVIVTPQQRWWQGKSDR